MSTQRSSMMCIRAPVRVELTPGRMLYEFHKSQNAKRPGAVHATYLVYGTKKASDGPSASQNGTDGDIDMTSLAPEVESLTEAVPTSTLSLVPEEKLKGCFPLLPSMTTSLTRLKRPLRTMTRSLPFTSTVSGLTRQRFDATLCSLTGHDD
jgi:hypothetical protein